MAESPERTVNIPAAVLAWLWPGLGHISLGHVRRGLLIMAGTLFLFFGGVLVGGIDSVDKENDTLWFYAQAGCGPIAFATNYANGRLLKTGQIGRMITPAGPAPQGATTVPMGTVNEYTGIAHVNEYGTLFSALAGLMNVAVILDALSRPRAAAGFVDRRKPA